MSVQAVDFIYMPALETISHLYSSFRIRILLSPVHVFCASCLIHQNMVLEKDSVKFAIAGNEGYRFILEMNAWYGMYTSSLKSVSHLWETSPSDSFQCVEEYT